MVEAADGMKISEIVVYPGRRSWSWAKYGA